MKLSHILLAAALALPRQLAQANYVFAHVVVGNTAAHVQSTWAQDITLAKAAGIDAFALNIAYPDGNIPAQVAYAFAAAEAAGGDFKLFFSFDYLGGGQTWPATGDNSVSSYLLKYKGSKAYFNYANAPFVSTFEGTGNIADWAPGGAIREAVGAAYFVPDWTSLGTGGIGGSLDNIQGFFSWDMWPSGASNMTTAADKAWQSAIGSSKTYMMGVSPWFFHSASGGLDWVWRGDDLWADRWAQVLEVKPMFVEIVTWNDFAESHYIGPIHSTSEIAAGSEVYVDGLPHDSWREFLPYYIAKYKNAPFTITRDQMQYWYRLSPAAAGSACGVVGNNAQQGQTQLSPTEVLEDGIFFSALLVSAAEVRVQIANGAVMVKQGVAGINHWSVPFAGQVGTPYFSIWRGGKFVQGANGAVIKTMPLSNGCTNYNPYVGSF